ncbi:hypothetical protein AABC73_20650 [Pseudomonas sp. G.S.17]|uniref:hypothetical protein n=1 Tax=Pseudomonas sp. G.S.17 TaxID=3137451 RepID=UPI00311CBE30
MSMQILTLEHHYCESSQQSLFSAAGGVCVTKALDAATDRLESVVAALAALMNVGAVSEQATLAFYAAESALALVCASHAGVEAFECAPQNADIPNRGATGGEA